MVLVPVIVVMEAVDAKIAAIAEAINIMLDSMHVASIPTFCYQATDVYLQAHLATISIPRHNDTTYTINAMGGL